MTDLLLIDPVLALEWAALPGKFLYLLYVAAGLGLVIFFHELGHFAVAKWCDVKVERFSIGFGPILLAKTRGETEYALSAVPFGGYVKMLGQDDIDPSQLTSEEIARDPRSYSAKPVWQRMAIISAGVVMNLVTAVGFFAVAFGVGVPQIRPVVGSVETGSPAWRAGVDRGDVVTAIGGSKVTSFGDVIRGTALSTGDVELTARRPDGEEYTVTLAPDAAESIRRIGLGSSGGTTLGKAADGRPALLPGSPATTAEPPFEAGDELVAVAPVGDDGAVETGRTVPLESAEDVYDAAARFRDRPVVYTVRRGEGETAKELAVRVGTMPFLTTGLRVAIGKVAAVRRGSPADGAGLKPGDALVRVDGREVGADLDPFRLPDYFADRAGEPVTVTVQREVTGGDPAETTLTLTPADRPGWIERPVREGLPLSVPALGAAFHVIPKVIAVEPGSPAEKAGLERNDWLTKVELVLPEGTASDTFGDDADDRGPIAVPLTGERDESRNWAHAFALSQNTRTRHLKLTIKRGDKRLTATVAPEPAGDWFFPARGLLLGRDEVIRRADGVGDALAMGLDHTRDSIAEMYLTLRSLITGRLGFDNLRGPAGIVDLGSKVAESGFAQFLLFLGFLSVNLAVLNFLPIPILDGGHMVFLLYEAVTRRRPSERLVAAATYAGLVFIVGLMLSVTYLDLFVHKVFGG